MILTVCNHVLKNVPGVRHYATHVWVCVLEYVVSHVMLVPLPINIAAGGVMYNVTKYASPTAMICV